MGYIFQETYRIDYIYVRDDGHFMVLHYDDKLISH